MLPRLRLILTTLIVVLALLISACQPVSTSPDPQRLAQVRGQLELGNFSGARHLIEDADGAKLGGEAAYLLGACEHGLNHPERAVEVWGTIPPSSPFYAQAALARAQTLATDLGRFARAEEVLRTLLNRSQPEAVVARHALFQLCFYQGRQDEMRRLIESAWDQLPDPVQELKDHWRIDHVNPDLEAIREAVESARQKAPDDDRVWLALAYLDTLEGRLGEARRRLDACLKKRPDDPALWRASLRLARESGDRPLAERALEHLDRDRPEVLDARAWLAEQAGQTDRAAALLRQRLQTGPVSADLVGRLLALELRSGDTSRAESLRERLRQVQQDDVRYRALVENAEPSSFEELARLAESLNRRFEARGWTTLALRRKPGDRALLDQLRRFSSPPSPRPLP